MQGQPGSADRALCVLRRPPRSGGSSSTYSRRSQNLVPRPRSPRVSLALRTCPAPKVLTAPAVAILAWPRPTGADPAHPVALTPPSFARFRPRGFGFVQL